MKMKYTFGDKIRTVREKKSITIKELALKIGVTESLISQIERNKVSPAIDTLLKIIDALNIDLEFIFKEYRQTEKVNLVRLDERKKIVIPGVVYELLSKTSNDEDKHNIESYYMVIDPGAETGSTEYGHPGKELGLILEGEAELTIGNSKYALQAGDSISFLADLPHQLKNRGTVKLKAIWTITPPKKFI